jgi:hypothetical protein
LQIRNREHREDAGQQNPEARPDLIWFSISHDLRKRDAAPPDVRSFWLRRQMSIASPAPLSQAPLGRNHLDSRRR